MKTGTIIALAVAAVVIGVIGVYMIDVDQTEEAKLPSVDVNVESGNMPKFDANVGSVEITEEKSTVTVPKVEVTTEEKEITVPGISISPPEDAADEKAPAN